MTTIRTDTSFNFCTGSSPRVLYLMYDVSLTQHFNFTTTEQNWEADIDSYQGPVKVRITWQFKPH